MVLSFILVPIKSLYTVTFTLNSYWFVVRRANAIWLLSEVLESENWMFKDVFVDISVVAAVTPITEFPVIVLAMFI